MRPWVAWASLALTACGSRTGLLLTPSVEETAGRDAGAVVDAAPAIDAAPAADASPGQAIQVVLPAQAPEGVYTYALAQFDAPTGTFGVPRSLSCLAAVRDRPLAVAPRCDGTVFIPFANGGLWRVDAATGNCTILSPDYAAVDLPPLASLTSAISPEGDERLYLVAGDVPSARADFAWLDPATLAVTNLGAIAYPSSLHMTATAAEQLFFYEGDTLERVDETTGAPLTTTALGPGGPWVDQPLAFWGGAFYLFVVTPSDTTDVYRWRPGDPQPTLAAHDDALVLAAGVSPCAPLQ